MIHLESYLSCCFLCFLSELSSQSCHLNCIIEQRLLVQLEGLYVDTDVDLDEVFGQEERLPSLVFIFLDISR